MIIILLGTPPSFCYSFYNFFYQYVKELFKTKFKTSFKLEDVRGFEPHFRLYGYILICKNLSEVVNII